MNISLNRSDINFRTIPIEILFLCSYVLLIISTIGALKNLATVYNLIIGIRILCFICIVILWSYFSLRRNKICKWALFFILFVSPYVFTEGYQVYIDTSILLIVASSLNIKNCARQYFVFAATLSVIIVLFIAISAKVGLLPSTVWETAGRSKDAFGFKNPNNLYFYLFSASCIFYYFRAVKGFFFTGFVLIGLYVLAQSRTGLIGYLLLSILWLMERSVPRSINILCLKIWFWLLCVIGLVMTLYPAETSLLSAAVFGIDADELLSNRLLIAESGLKHKALWDLLFGGYPNYNDSLFAYFTSGLGILLTALLLAFLYKETCSVSKTVIVKRLAVVNVFLTVGLVEVVYGADYLIALLLVWIIYTSKSLGSGNTFCRS